MHGQPNIKFLQRTVEPRFTNLIHSWRPFITQNVRKPKLCVLSESYTANDTLPPILPAFRQLLLPACVFVTRDTVCHPRLFFSENLFVMRGIREPRFHCVLYRTYLIIITYSKTHVTKINTLSCHFKTYSVKI
jgi:hypothetical protein